MPNGQPMEVDMAVIAAQRNDLNQGYQNQGYFTQSYGPSFYGASGYSLQPNPIIITQ
jgi:hypothetical protein